jgi:hypothetical protein
VSVRGSPISHLQTGTRRRPEIVREATFAESGFDAVTVADVAWTVDVSEVTVSIYESEQRGRWWCRNWHPPAELRDDVVVGLACHSRPAPSGIRAGGRRRWLQTLATLAAPLA